MSDDTKTKFTSSGEGEQSAGCWITTGAIVFADCATILQVPAPALIADVIGWAYELRDAAADTDHLALVSHLETWIADPATNQNMIAQDSALAFRVKAAPNLMTLRSSHDIESYLRLLTRVAITSRSLTANYPRYEDLKRVGPQGIEQAPFRLRSLVDAAIDSLSANATLEWLLDATSSNELHLCCLPRLRLQARNTGVVMEGVVVSDEAKLRDLFIRLAMGEPINRIAPVKGVEG